MRPRGWTVRPPVPPGSGLEPALPRPALPRHSPVTVQSSGQAGDPRPCPRAALPSPGGDLAAPPPHPGPHPTLGPRGRSRGGKVSSRRSDHWGSPPRGPRPLHRQALPPCQSPGQGPTCFSGAPPRWAQTHLGHRDARVSGKGVPPEGQAQSPRPQPWPPGYLTTATRRRACSWAQAAGPGRGQRGWAAPPGPGAPRSGRRGQRENAGRPPALEPPHPTARPGRLSQ